MEVSNGKGDACDTTISCGKEYTISDLSSFVFKRVLCENSQRKTICAEGTIDNKEAVLFLEKTPITDGSLKLLCTVNSVVKKQYVNDVYGSYECFPEANLNGIKTTLIYPATEKHIKKFESHPVHIVEETPELYNEVTLPFISTDAFKVTWVYNILEHKAEEDRIVFEDTDATLGFMLLPDLKWDGKQVENLYLLALVHQRGIKSLRDVTDKHLPLLKNIRDKGSEAIEKKYGLDKSRLRIYLHYQPSYYHLHVHFTYLSYEAPGIYAERAHLLSTVISNIEIVSDYYQRATLPFTVKETDNLFLLFRDKGLLKEVENKKD